MAFQPFRLPGTVTQRAQGWTPPQHIPGLNTDSAAYKDVIALIGEAGVRHTFSPIDQPSGLPNEAYWSPDWLQLENKRIFARSWVFAASDGELAGTGAIKPLDIAGTPVILVRDAAGQVRAFHNVCRHRGTQLVSEACTVQSITCPYHAWIYGLDGQLAPRARTSTGPANLSGSMVERPQMLRFIPSAASTGTASTLSICRGRLIRWKTGCSRCWRAPVRSTFRRCAGSARRITP